MTDRDYAALPRAIAAALGAEQRSITAVADGRGADTMTGPIPDTAQLRFCAASAYRAIIGASGAPTTAAIIASVTANVPAATPADDVAGAVAAWRDGFAALDVRAAILIADAANVGVLRQLKLQIEQHQAFDGTVAIDTATERSALTAAIAALTAAGA